MQGLDGDSLDFVATTNSLVTRYDRDRYLQSDVNEIGYRLRPNPNYDDFLEIYRREDMGVDDDPTEGGKYYKVCDGVRSLRLDWFAEDPGEPGSDDADGKTEWDAKKEGKLPWACRVTLVLVGPGEPDDDVPPPEWTFQQYVAFRSRIRGVYFSIITQAFTYALMLLFFRNDTGFGGNNGLTDFKTLYGYSLADSGTKLGLYTITAIPFDLNLFPASLLSRGRTPHQKWKCENVDFC